MSKEHQPPISVDCSGMNGRVAESRFFCQEGVPSQIPSKRAKPLDAAEDESPCGSIVHYIEYLTFPRFSIIPKV